ncbi:MAG: NADH-quinone oxidoreductase subunit C [Planctomycetaceae bacterium]|jgi:NADH-quinone oxidoreductase subunit C|nr:NADH-quinone oxidoreductase subunit C [Planctomycetaceae bacterium]MBT6155481.1 NADH-quinone oxidoreductase subunit C [Planctomycetaceae bacterium]MBT6483675.1 NADH-quinone oxidoreductase subunit C [Planctomycetaceae bacterium]MBT6496282.1 NADH-quinone oxidoreductase subunit C [Planctomycetaceae bacterium]
MTTTEIFDLLVSQFGSEKIVAINTEAIDPWIEVAPAAIHEVAQFLKSDERLILHHLNNLTAVDYFQPDPKKAAKFGHDPHLELVYHLSSYDLRHSLVVKVKLPRWQNDVEGDIPEIDSVADVWAIADWHEREAYDLMGIKFGGHPNLRRILCPEDWVGHPLRKDYEFPLEYHGIRGK